MELEKQIEFVRMNVENLVARHAKAVEEACGMLDEEAILRNSGLEGINEDMDVLESLIHRISTLSEEHDELRFEFDEKYNPDELVVAETKKCSNCMESQKADFDFRIRESLGQIYLGNREDALKTLSECRREVYDLENN